MQILEGETDIRCGFSGGFAFTEIFGRVNTRTIGIKHDGCSQGSRHFQTFSFFFEIMQDLLFRKLKKRVDLTRGIRLGRLFYDGMSVIY